MNKIVMLITIVVSILLVGCTPTSYEQLATLQTNLNGCQIERIAKQHNDDCSSVAWLITNSQKQQFVVWFHDVRSIVYVKRMGLPFDQPSESIELVPAWQMILQQAEKPIDIR